MGPAVTTCSALRLCLTQRERVRVLGKSHKRRRTQAGLKTKTMCYYFSLCRFRTVTCSVHASLLLVQSFAGPPVNHGQDYRLRTKLHTDVPVIRPRLCRQRHQTVRRITAALTDMFRDFFVFFVFCFFVIELYRCDSLPPHIFSCCCYCCCFVCIVFCFVCFLSS